MAYNIEFDFFVYAPQDEVMELLTNPVFIEEWSGKKASFDKQVGGKFELFDGWVKGEVINITENELAYTWQVAEWETGTAASEVLYKLVPLEHGTEVYVQHKNLPSAEEVENHENGWRTFFVEPIGEYLANRKHG